jgi:phage shock protein PspC (stress-responsive transcriptional regulator)
MYNRVRRTTGKDSKIYGVCGGISKYLDPEADPIIMRLIFIFMALFSGVFPMAFIYVILAMVLKRESLEIDEDE